jgi:hypothetical protein
MAITSQARECSLPRCEGSKSLPTLANTFGVKMPFSCAAHFPFEIAISAFIYAVYVVIHAA